MSDEESDSKSLEVNLDQEAGEGPTPLAQVMANILASSSSDKKKKAKAAPILSKVGVQEKPERDKALLLLKREARRKRELAKIAWERMGMVKPSIQDKDRERNFAKVATKGVVQLFNAVSAQQDRLRSKLAHEGTTDVKRTKIVENLSRSSFIDLLKSQSGVKSEKQGASAKFEPKRPGAMESKPKWRTLRDDFVLSEYASGLGANGPESDAEGVKAEPA